jgi:hypothetical protein
MPPDQNKMGPNINCEAHSIMPYNYLKLLFKTFVNLTLLK